MLQSYVLSLALRVLTAGRKLHVHKRLLEPARRHRDASTLSSCHLAQLTFSLAPRTSRLPGRGCSIAGERSAIRELQIPSTNSLNTCFILFLK